MLHFHRYNITWWQTYLTVVRVILGCAKILFEKKGWRHIFRQLILLLLIAKTIHPSQSALRRDTPSCRGPEQPSVWQRSHHQLPQALHPVRSLGRDGNCWLIVVSVSSDSLQPLDKNNVQLPYDCHNDHYYQFISHKFDREKKYLNCSPITISGSIMG